MELTKVKEIISQTQNTENRFAFKPVIKHLLSFTGGFIFMNPFVLGQLSPFSLSLTAALDGALSFCSCAGGILGAFVFFDGTEAFRYISASVLFILLKEVFSKFPELKLSRFFGCMNAFLCSFSTGLAVTLATGTDSEKLLAVCYESALTCAGACIFENSSKTIWEKQDISGLSTVETAQIIILSGIALMHLYKYKLLDFSPVITVFCLIILVFSKLKNELGGAVSGICLAASAGLSGNFGFSAIGLALGGLGAGGMARHSRHLCALGFFVPVLICAAADRTAGAYMTILEALLAGSVFLVIPEGLFSFLCGKFNSPSPVCIRDSSSLAVSKKLMQTSETIGQISDCVNSVRQTMKLPLRTQLDSAVRCTWQKVCSECKFRGGCPDEIKSPSDEDLERIVSALLTENELNKNAFSKSFCSSCYRLSDMCSEIRRRYSVFTAGLGAQGQICQIQDVMSDQFRNISAILKSLADDFSDETGLNSETADCCAAEAREFGLDIITANGSLDRFGRFFLSLGVSPDSRFDVIRLTDSLSAASGLALDCPEITEKEDITELRFSQKIDFDISIGAFSRPKDGEAVCGDYYRSFRDENGRYIVILSDGMGTGARAAVDSAMAAELFSKLVRSGLSFDCALPVVNSALLVKSSDESLSTLDVACVDLYTGKTEFLKAGAAATFIRSRGRIIQLEQESVPLGILSGVTFSKEEIRLEKDDIILMVSDGIPGDSNGWIQQELKMWSTETPAQKLAEHIVESAAERRPPKHRDDMTAVAVYIT